MNTWRSLWSLVRFRPGLYAMSALCASIMFYLLSLLPGLIVQRFFDVLTHSAPATIGLWSLMALLVGTGVARILNLAGAAYAETTVAHTAEALLRKNLLERILRRPGAAAVPYSPGEAISRFRDDAISVTHFLTWMVDPIGQTLVTLAALLILVHINALVTLGVFLPLAIVLSIVNMSNKRIRRYRQASQEGIGEVTNFLGEIFGSYLAVKIAGAEEHVTAHFGRVNDRRRRAALNDVLFTQVIQSISFNAGNLGTGLLLLLIAGSLRSGRFTVGDFALFVSYLGSLAQTTGMLGRFLALRRQVTVSLDRLQVLMQGAPPADLTRHSPVYLSGRLPAAAGGDAPAGHAEPLECLEACDLRYHYPSSIRGIEGISFRLERGSFTAITGRVGAGKTTLLRVLLGLLPADEGELRWNGVRIDDPGSFMVPPRVAYTAQVPRLFSETLRDNILLGLPEDGEMLRSALHAAVLERDLPSLERGLETLVGPRGVRLSGGQVQRAAAARMFVREPDLLIFDDLSSALDVETENLLWERLARRPGSTCLVVTHRPAALRRADQVIVLADGRVTAIGAWEGVRHQVSGVRT